MESYTLTKEAIHGIVKEYSFEGKYDGDTIFVGSFRRRNLPKPILSNVLKAIQATTGQRATSLKYMNGAYDNVEIRLFGQLITYLSGRW
jgi:hypothetical protein